MSHKLKIYTVILDERIARYPYLASDLAEKATDERGNPVYYMTCTEIHEGGTYFSATVSKPPSGEPRRVLLDHSFVVAVLEAVNLRNQPGFAPEESPA